MEKRKGLVFDICIKDAICKKLLKEDKYYCLVP